MNVMPKFLKRSQAIRCARLCWAGRHAETARGDAIVAAHTDRQRSLSKETERRLSVQRLENYARVKVKCSFFDDAQNKRFREWMWERQTPRVGVNIVCARFVAATMIAMFNHRRKRGIGREQTNDLLLVENSGVVRHC